MRKLRVVVLGFALSASATPASAACVTPTDMQALYKKVDPGNKLSDGARNVAALGAIWKYDVAHNDLTDARNAAADLLQHYKLMSQRRAAIIAALDHGYLDGAAAKAAMASYAQVPDGRDLKIVMAPDGKHFNYQFTDMKSGKAMQSVIATPQELTAEAMGLPVEGFEAILREMAATSSGRGVFCPPIAQRRPRVLPQVDPDFDVVPERRHRPKNCVTFKLDDEFATTTCD